MFFLDIFYNLMSEFKQMKCAKKYVFIRKSDRLHRLRSPECSFTPLTGRPTVQSIKNSHYKATQNAAESDFTRLRLNVGIR